MYDNKLNWVAAINTLLLYSSNILLTEHMQAKVADFGLAKYMPQPLPDKTYVRVESFRGTRGYSADEYMDGQLSPKLDVFSLGVVSKCNLLHVYSEISNSVLSEKADNLSKHRHNPRPQSVHSLDVLLYYN